MDMFCGLLKSPIGIIEINATSEALLSVKYIFDKKDFSGENKSSNLVADAVMQLNEYFNGKRMQFELPLATNIGTDFQIKVWQKLQKIPYGKTSSYLNLAIEMGSEKTIRAVAGANGKNPWAIIVPCHRVIGSDGKLVGYAGGLWRKKWLLEHEQKFKQLSFDF